MPRWEAGAEGRLAQAAYELYIERGFDHVTVAEIAERARLTKRTFFRYFADKREVLFSGAAAFQESVVAEVISAPDGVAPIDAVVAALAAVGTGLTELGEGARQRQRLIDTSTVLQEREMIKMVGSHHLDQRQPGAPRDSRSNGQTHGRGRGHCLQDRLRTLGRPGRICRIRSACPRGTR